MILLMLAALAPQDVAKARDTLLRATDWFQKQSKHGGYVWFFSADGQERWGESKVTPDQIWVQPPGTPAVGLAFLRAYAATKEPRLLEAAREAGRALLHGQLRSGGWTYSVDFDPRGKLHAAYRSGGGGRNTSTLDDDTTPCCLRFLAELDRALDFKDAAIHEGATAAVDALLAAQFANGGFPQGYAGPAEPRPVKPATRGPADWRELPRVKEYWNHYTLNDGLAGRMVDTLLVLQRVYGRKDVPAALEKLGDFLLLAKLPEPQPAWAQQYDVEMRPAWARKFEPPAVTGGESQDVCEALMAISEATKNAKYLEPVAPAIAYLRKSLLPDGRLARFYETHTNKPLWLTTDYRVVYDDGDLPAHYGFKVASRLDALEAELVRVKAGAPRPARAVAVKRAIETLDPDGLWVEEVSPKRGVPAGRWVLSSTFVRNVEVLSDFLEGEMRIGGLLLGISMLGACASGGAPATEAKGMLRHAVLFKFKDGTAPAAVKEIENAFRALPGKIPEIAAFEWGTNNSPEGLAQGFTHCFFVSFRDAKGREAYLPHAAHLAFVEVLKPHLDKVLVIDYEAKD